MSRGWIRNLVFELEDGLRSTSVECPELKSVWCQELDVRWVSRGWNRNSVFELDDWLRSAFAGCPEVELGILFWSSLMDFARCSLGVHRLNSIFCLRAWGLTSRYVRWVSRGHWISRSFVFARQCLEAPCSCVRWVCWWRLIRCRVDFQF